LVAARFIECNTRLLVASKSPEYCNEPAVDAYLADPLCGFSLDAQGMADITIASSALAQPRGIPADLPICVLVGDHDPLNAELSLSKLLVERYSEAGLIDVTYLSYPEARHELFHETNKQEIVSDLLAWLNRVLARRPRRWGQRPQDRERLGAGGCQATRPHAG
jgi:hypothetical protein